MADNKEVLGLDLDVTDFKEGIDAAKEGLSSLAEGTGLENLGGLVMGIGGSLTAIGVAALALKTTFDLVFEGDQIKRTDELFSSLSQTMGVAGDAFKNDIIKAAGGMADTNAVLSAANKAMIELGKNSGMIPDIMQVARKVTMEFGGDVTERFQQISMAVATGNTRLLRQSGIVIDTNAAFKDYAKSLGVTADELNESGRQQATFNALMKFSSTNLKSVNVDLDDSTMAWTKLKTEVKEASDTIASAFSKAFGPAITGMFHAFTGVIKDASTTLKAEFGNSAESSAAQLQILENRANSFKKAIEQMNEHKGFFSWLASGLFINKGADALKKLQAGLADTEKQITEMKKTAGAADVSDTKKTEDAKSAIVKAAERDRNVDQEKLAADRKKAHEKALADLKKRQAEENKLADDTLKLKEQNAAKEVQQANSLEALERARDNRERAAEQMAAQERKKIDQDVANGTIKDLQQASKKKQQINLELLNKEKQYDKDYQKEHKAMLQNQLNDSKDVFSGIANAAKMESDQASEDIRNFGKQGQIVTSTFKKEGTASFEAFGQAAIDHSQSASQIMKGFFLNSLADMAQAEGELFLVAGLGDPSKLAAGAALLVLSGALRSMAGSAGASDSSSLGSGGGGGSTGATSSAASSTPSAAAATPTGSLTMNIQGDYLNTAETQRTLVQAIQNASDQTGFQYLPIGQTGAQNV